MKRKSEKDERLDSLFSEYAQSEKMPSENVTSPAKEYLNKQRKPEKIRVATPATAGNEGTVRPIRTYKSGTIFYITAFVLFAIVITVVCYFSAKKSDRRDFLSYPTTVTSDKLSEANGTEYTDKNFLPFIDDASVNEYREYVLTEKVGTFDKGDVVVYYVLFATSENVAVSLYVEEKGFYWAALDEYKHMTTETEVDGITVFVNSDAVHSKCYFSYNDFGYNISIHTNDNGIANEILSYISESLKKIN